MTAYGTYGIVTERLKPELGLVRNARRACKQGTDKVCGHARKARKNLRCLMCNT
jgi:hypothetical protein